MIGVGKILRLIVTRGSIRRRDTVVTPVRSPFLATSNYTRLLLGALQVLIARHLIGARSVVVLWNGWYLHATARLVPNLTTLLPRR